MSLCWRVVLCCPLLLVADGAFCQGKPKPGPTNLYAVQSAFPKFIGSFNTAASLYEVAIVNESVKVLHMFSSDDYTNGLAHGTLLADEVGTFLTLFWKDAEHGIEEDIESFGFPAWFAAAVTAIGFYPALDAQFDLLRPFIPADFLVEMEGIADGSGVELVKLHRLHAFIELTRGSTCSLIGAWGTATPHGELVQLRALDTDVDPMRQFPLVLVYHNASTGRAFFNQGFAGFIGALAGGSSDLLGISDISVSLPDASFGSQSRIGIPFIALLRDVLKRDASLAAALRRIRASRRTYDLLLGIGDGKMLAKRDQQAAGSSDAAAVPFAGIQYSHTVCNVFTDVDLQPDNATWHTRMPGVVYWAMDWNCPSYNFALQEALLAHQHGNVSASSIMHAILPAAQSGSLQVTVYDFSQQAVYMSFARQGGGADASVAESGSATDDSWDDHYDDDSDVGGGPLYAYQRPYVRFNTTELFSQPPPPVA